MTAWIKSDFLIGLKGTEKLSKGNIGGQFIMPLIILNKKSKSKNKNLFLNKYPKSVSTHCPSKCILF